MQSVNIVVTFLVHGARDGGVLLFKAAHCSQIQQAWRSTNWHQQLLGNLDEWTVGTAFAKVWTPLIDNLMGIINSIHVVLLCDCRCPGKLTVPQHNIIAGNQAVFLLLQVLENFLANAHAQAVITLLMDFCHAAAAFKHFEQLRAQFEHANIKIALFAACQADELAFGRSFCPLVCGSLSPEKHQQVLNEQHPCFVHTTGYPLTGGIFDVRTV